MQFDLFTPPPPPAPVAAPAPLMVAGTRTRQPIWWPAIGEGPGITRPFPHQGWATATRPILSGWEQHGKDQWYRFWRYPAPETRPAVVRDAIVAASAEWVPRNPWNGWVVRWYGEREPIVCDLVEQAKSRADAGLGRWAVRWDVPRVVLVSCSGPKLSVPAPAKDLYTSSLFRKARAYAEGVEGASWAILSAEYGLVWPDEVVSPYDKKLSSLSAEERQRWGAAVAREFPHVTPGHTVEIHAGETYCAPIREQLAALGWQVEEPLSGLEIGQRLQWYGRRDDVAALSRLGL